MAIWIESILGIQTDSQTNKLIRAKPRSLTGKDGVAQLLSKATNISEEQGVEAIKNILMGGYQCEPNPETGFTPFAFRLHQFISRGDTVYSSIEKETDRYITVYGQKFVPGDRNRILLPIVFCRECGQEYFCVWKCINPSTGETFIEQRDLSDRENDEENEAGYIYMSEENPWPEDPNQILEKIPDDWTEFHKGNLRIKRNRRDDLPIQFVIDSLGQVGGEGVKCHFVTMPFRFCLQCGVSYDSRQRSDFSKLSSLGSEGRSTATTILSLATIMQLTGDSTLPEKARKLLSFTDNRQDASLQAGHFNDFIEIGLLRGALFKAIKDAGENGIKHEELSQKVFDALNLSKTLFASDPEVRFQAEEETKRALRDVIGYRLYRDLKRGWRITSPNLEQCGFLKIKYLSIEDLCQAEDVWGNLHPALSTASPTTRIKVSKVLLDHMRREVAIKVDYLDQNYQDQLKQRSNQRLKAPWGLDEDEKMDYSAILFPRSKSQNDYAGNVFLSSRGGVGQYLRRTPTLPEYEDKLSLEDTQTIFSQLLEALIIGGLVRRVREPESQEDVPGYQLMASAFIWVAGDGSGAFHDPVRVPREAASGSRTNSFFKHFYTKIALETKGLEAREHTAQVRSEQREDRENRFKKGSGLGGLPILYCSPTMELGVDISELNVVNLRNIPPTPANYAQRSGRAGRSGQPALVFSYCSTGSSHDQYFFKRPHLMVSGAVSPPRLDLTNEDLIQAHIHSIWLAETGEYLGTSLKEILDLAGDEPSLELLQRVKDGISNPRAKEKARERSINILEQNKEELLKSDWFSEGWLDEVLNQVEQSFDNACNRWRTLYRSALDQVKLQTRVVTDASRSHGDKEKAKRLRREAESQLSLLTEAASIFQSDFYSYRYFASEGFLPGYNFPRLPLSAFIPGRRQAKGRDEFLSRPRFLAIHEFGPRAVVYHEGSKYLINKVNLPVESQELLTTSAKLCPSCGYYHPIQNEAGPDICEHCRTELSRSLNPLFRLENVTTIRREKINSDEEERLRLGYEIKTGIRFAERGGQVTYRIGAVTTADEEVARLTYGSAANLWRINLGWMKRKNLEQFGFVLDIERGYWARNAKGGDDGPAGEMGPQTARVIPFVEDRRNCLLIDWDQPLSFEEFVTIQAALKNSIQIMYQLEDNELTAEPLPGRNNPKTLLLYESTEGGAGVLKLLLDDPSAVQEVGKLALQLCHFDPETGDDLKKAPGSEENCEAACYNCLMHYGNQRDHKALDRQIIKDLLLSLASSNVIASPAEVPRAEHLQKLKTLAGSGLEKKWLDFLEDNNLRLPSHAQKFFDQCKTRPDFYYENCQTTIYVDGSPHEYQDRQERDAQQTECMEDLGYTVIRFSLNNDWLTVINNYPHVFGNVS